MTARSDSKSRHLQREAQAGQTSELRSGRLAELELQLPGMVERQCHTLTPAQVAYLRGHLGDPVNVAEHFRTVRAYAPWILPGALLDWGCNQGFDALCARTVWGDQVQVFGCDVPDIAFPEFWSRSGLSYTRLTHPYQLPYRDEQFATIIGAGTLEHVPDDAASLRELWRCLCPWGRLILTYLPSRHSLIEAALRLAGKPHHKRRYTVGGLRHLLLGHGFIPILIRFHYATPTFTGFEGFPASSVVKRVSMPFARVAEASWPLNRLTQNLLVVAQKATGIGAEFFEPAAVARPVLCS